MDSFIQKITVKNFGPVREAVIEERDFSVFMGTNNIGKSYLAKLVYAIHRTLENYYNWMNGLGFAFESNKGRKKGKKLVTPDATEDEITEKLSRFIRFSNASKDINKKVKADHDLLGDWLSSARNTKKLKFKDLQGLDSLLASSPYHQYLSSEFSKQLERLFPTNYLSNKWRITIDFRGGVRFELSRAAQTLASIEEQKERGNQYVIRFAVCSLNVHYPDDLKEKFTLELSRSNKDIQCTVRGDKEVIRINYDLRLPLPQGVKKGVFRFMMAPVSYLAYRLGALIGGATTIYLPASRSGLVQSYQLVNTILMGNLDNFILYNREVPSYSGEVQDFLQVLMSSTSTKKVSRDNAELIGAIEEILGGSIAVERQEGGGTEIRFVKDKMSFRLRHVSSMISELSSLVLLLRSGAINSGTYLIIEEPESHLHPDNQIKMVNILTKLKVHGIRVLLTTHSPTLMDKMVNVVLSSGLLKEGNLPKKDVEMYYFTRTNKGTEVNRLDYDEIRGFADVFRGSAEQIINELDDIYGRVN